MSADVVQKIRDSWSWGCFNESDGAFSDSRLSLLMRDVMDNSLHMAPHTHKMTLGETYDLREELAVEAVKRIRQILPPFYRLEQYKNGVRIALWENVPSLQDVYTTLRYLREDDGLNVPGHGGYEYIIYRDGIELKRGSPFYIKNCKKWWKENGVET